MGVYIKGMKMPKNCGACPFCVPEADEDRGDICVLCGQFPLAKDEKSCECPLVPVLPHGRLIDGDYLKHTHCAECTLYPDKCLEKTGDGCDLGSIMHLRMCPTIIEAEEADA